MATGLDWTKSCDDELRELRSLGRSFKEIAADINRKFGTAYSRNACIGRVKRLGLTCGVRALALNRAATASRREDIKRLRRENPEFAPVKRAGRRYSLTPKMREEISAAPSIAPSSIPVGSIAFRAIHAIKSKTGQQQPRNEIDTRPLRCVEIEPLHLSIFDLMEDSCRWPYGGWAENRGITFCGHSKLEGLSYCPAHQELSTGPGTRSEQSAHYIPKDKSA